MDQNFYSIFSKEHLAIISKKLKPLLLNSAKKGKSNFTHFELFKYNPLTSKSYDVLDINDIFIDELKSYEIKNKFLNNKQQNYNYIEFQYKNVKLITQQDTTDYCEQLLSDMLIIQKDGILGFLSEISLISPAHFSCRNDMKRKEFSETRIYLSSTLPIYLSVIFDKSLEKYYIKFWFEINENIDEILSILT